MADSINACSNGCAEDVGAEMLCWLVADSECVVFRQFAAMPPREEPCRRCVFVTAWQSACNEPCCKRWPFAPQKATFQALKSCFSGCDMPSFMLWPMLAARCAGGACRWGGHGRRPVEMRAGMRKKTFINIKSRKNRRKSLVMS